jgi:hypothetical protein
MEAARDDARICRDRALMAVAAERDLGKAQAMWLLARNYNKRVRAERAGEMRAHALLAVRGRGAL